MIQPNHTSNQPPAGHEDSAPPKAGQGPEHHHKPHKEPPRQMLVRYGLMGHLGWFEHHEKHVPKTATHAVIKTDRGLELGQVVGIFNYRHGNFRCSCEQVVNYYGKGQERCPVYSGGSFVRFGTKEDLMEARHLEQQSRQEMRKCEEFIRELGLSMKMVDSEHLFGGERIVFYFTSEGRVDFRELVKRLAKEYQTRIELRQIGSRDEARILADFESCGQEVCCKRYLKILEPVNMKMAKLQKATLDPSKISGHCGRLKCCLRYEDQTYRELKRNLPRKNALVQTAKGTGRVFDVQILTQLVLVQYDNGDREAWPVEEIKVVGEQGGPRGPQGDDDDDFDESIPEENVRVDLMPDDERREAQLSNPSESEGGGQERDNRGPRSQDNRNRRDNRGNRSRRGGRNRGRGQNNRNDRNNRGPRNQDDSRRDSGNEGGRDSGGQNPNPDPNSTNPPDNKD